MSEHHDKLRSDNKDFQKIENQIDRRQFLTKTSLGLGALALSSLLNIDKVWGGVNAQKNEYLNYNKKTIKSNGANLETNIPGLIKLI